MNMVVLTSIRTTSLKPGDRILPHRTAHPWEGQIIVRVELPVPPSVLAVIHTDRSWWMSGIDAVHTVCRP